MFQSESTISNVREEKGDGIFHAILGLFYLQTRQGVRCPQIMIRK